MPRRPAVFRFAGVVLHRADAFDWLATQPDCSIHAVVTDPPYGLREYSATEQRKLRARRGGIWRSPPAFDGARRAPLPRFTVLTPEDHAELERFFGEFARALHKVLVPGAHVALASQPLLSDLVALALSRGGLERRAVIARRVVTLRGGDRPKGAHREFAEVSVMPRAMWEPWLLYRKPLEGRVRDNLRRWRTGALRRPEVARPFADLIESAPASRRERVLAPHPSLKPQAFLRALVRAMLPLGEGVVLDPFAGSGSTLAAAHAVGYPSIGIERDARYYRLARRAIPALAGLTPGVP